VRKKPVLSLKPTQLAIGMREVELKLKKLDSLGKRKLARYVSRHPVEVIRSPQNELYVIDRHHTLAALWLLGVKKVPIKVTRDYSAKKMSRAKFWRFLSKRRLVHLYDQFGHGPHDPMYLPKDVSGLGDDPYRSLAWLVEKCGAYEKSRKHYYEFDWAQFFRERKLLHPSGRFQLDGAVRKAVRLTRSQDARGLPGYRPSSRK
jgi:hypothetical protein